ASGDGHPAERVTVGAGRHLAEAVEFCWGGCERRAASGPEGGAVITAFFAVGTLAAEPRSAHIDDVSVDLPDVVKLDAQPASRAGQKICQEYVAGSDQLMQDVQRLRPLKREADAAFPAVGVLHQ